MARPKKEDNTKTIVCVNCNSNFEIEKYKNRQFCSKSCSQIYTKSKNKDWLTKRDNTNLEKYGVKSPLESNEIREKYKSNLMEKYGVDNPFLLPEFREKANNTIIEKYGVTNASKNSEIAKKISDAIKGIPKNRINFVKVKWDKILNYCKEVDMVPLFEENDILENKLTHGEGNKFKFKCNKCKNTTEVSLSNGYFPSCNCSEYKGYSLIEDEINRFIIDNSSYEIQLKNRSILPNRLELDIYLPQIKKAIEINGIYWHSESMGKYREYHLYKTKKCIDHGVQLIHIFDYEWLFKKPIISSMLMNKLGLMKNKIYARECVIKEIEDTKILREFLDNNHLQGYCYSKVNIGLYHNDKLVSLMTFGKNRFKKNSNEMELVRFCNELNLNVVGGASKLFKYFIKNHNSEKLDVITFADRRFSEGGLYDKLGFEFVSYTSPSYFYWKNNKILSRMSCQKHKLHKFLENFNDALPEYENMLNNGYRRVWDCGNIKYVYKIKGGQ